MDQARRKAQVPLDVLRAQREANRDQNDHMLVLNRKNQRRTSMRKLQKRVPEVPKRSFELTGTSLQETIKRHRNAMMRSKQTMPIHYTLA